MPAKTVIRPSEAIPEGSDATVHAEFVDGNGAAINSGAVSAITATLINQRGTRIKNLQNVFNANGGTLSAGGLFDLELSETDTAAVESGPEFQPRYLTLVVTHSSTKTLVHSITFYIQKVPGP